MTTLAPSAFAVCLVLWASMTVCASSYCGWRVLDRRVSKAPIATTLQDQVFGLTAMLLGIFIFSWLPFTLGTMVHQWALGGAVTRPMGGELFCAVLGTMVAAGLIGCGARVCAVVRWVPWICRGWTNVFDAELWQRFFARCSMVAGVVGICFLYCVGVHVAHAAPLFR